MVDNITTGQMKSINATTKQQVEEGKIEVLKGIASYFKDNLPTPGKKGATGTLKSTQEAIDFKNEIDKIITEGDLSGAFKKFNDKLMESTESISDYIDAQDSANAEFIKNFNKYSKERTNAERKQSNLARENIATRIDENNELQILKNFEIEDKQKEIKNLRDEIEKFEKQLKKRRGLTAEEISAKFDEIEERRLQIREIKDLGVKEKKKFDDTMFRFEVLDNSIAYLDENTLKFREKVGNFIAGITPEPIRTGFQLIITSIQSALEPILTLFKPLKIFIPIMKFFGVGILGAVKRFKQLFKTVEKDNKVIAEHTVLTKEQMDATKKLTVLTKEQMEAQGKKSKKEGADEKKRTGIFGKLGGAVGKVSGIFSKISMMLPLLLFTLVPLIGVFLLFKNKILGFVDMIFGTEFQKQPENVTTSSGIDTGIKKGEGLGATFGDGIDDAELKKMAETQIDKENPEMSPYQKKQSAKDRKKELETMMKTKEGRADLLKKYEGTEFEEVIAKNVASRTKKELISENLKLRHSMKNDEFSFKINELNIDKIKKQMDPNSDIMQIRMQDQLKRGSYQPMTKFQKDNDAMVEKGLERLQALTMKRYELNEELEPKRRQVQANATAINNINNSQNNTTVGANRGVFDVEMLGKILPALVNPRY